MAFGRIVLVDDEPDLRDAYAEYLTRLGYEALAVGDGVDLAAEMARRPVDLVVLDLGLPGDGGMSILRRLKQDDGVAVLILTGNPDVIERVLGLELGADDFVVKPIDPRELAARISGILARRRGRRASPMVGLEHGSVDIKAARFLRNDGGIERLSASEVALIRVFSEKAGQVLSRAELLEEAPGEDEEALERAVDSRITRLRRKLETEAIRTVPGRGYMFLPPR